jgi:Holliday junction resolvase
MNAKAKGNRNERPGIAILEASGYRCTRSAASLGEWDIIAIDSTGHRTVAVKTRHLQARIARQTRRGGASAGRTHGRPWLSWNEAWRQTALSSRSNFWFVHFFLCPFQRQPLQTSISP